MLHPDPFFLSPFSLSLLPSLALSQRSPVETISNSHVLPRLPATSTTMKKRIPFRVPPCPNVRPSISH